MAYFEDTEEFGVFVAANLVGFINEQVPFCKADIRILKCTLFEEEYKILADTVFLKNHGLDEGEVIDLVEFDNLNQELDLLPVKETLFKAFIQSNGIEWY